MLQDNSSDILPPLLENMGSDDNGFAASASAAAGPAPNGAADTAVAGAAARSAFGVTGAGVKVGIISDSFNARGQAGANQAAGYLPAVTVLGDRGGTDEGQAIAQLVYETAPGASILFNTVGTTLSSFASAVTALANAGCKIILDDVGVLTEPFFQPGDILERAIESFVAAGGNYFTSAGNNGGTYYQATFNSMTAVLPGTTAPVTAEDFGNHTFLESFTHTATFNLVMDLQWDTPFRSVGTGGPNGGGAQSSLALYVYDSNNNLIASSAANVLGVDPVQYLQVNNLAAGTYKVAVVLNGGTAPGTFRYEFVANNAVDTMSDPNANKGGGNLIGHAELADVNTVGAVPVNRTPSQGVAVPVVEAYSSTGPGEFLLDANGNRLPAPIFTGKVDFTAPDGASTSVSGFAPFYGTSAAAPIAAATAALLLQLQPGLTPAQVSATLAASAVGQGGGANVGAGLIQASAALSIADGAAGVGLVVDVSEDAFGGDAQFTATVDGQAVGGIYTVTASHAAGQSQAITLANVLGNGAHTVGISFINDAYGGSPSADRNLYVVGAQYNGTPVSGAAQTLLSNGTDTFSVPVGAASSSTAVLMMSEDAYQGDAQFVVSVDGTQYGGIYTVTALHGSGQSQAFTISGIPEHFSPHDIAVSFINDAYGGSPQLDRNLYVDAIQFDGQAVANASSALDWSRTQDFTVSAPSNYMG